MYNYSFIIPHKNCPVLLARCVNSIPHREDIQIIVVDDNSDVDKRPLFNRPNIQVVLLDAEHSKGAGRARNVGLEYAKGKWILFADADDYYKDGFISILDEYKNQQIDVLYFNFEYLDGKTGNLILGFPYSDYYSMYDGTKYCLEQLKFRVKVPWNKMVRRSYLENNKISFEETLNGNDIFFSLSVGFYVSKTVVDNRQVYVYLKNENSLVNSKKKDPASYICKINHKIQLNLFYNYIGHPEWHYHAFRYILYCLKVCGLKLLWKLIIQSSEIWAKRNAWVIFFKRKKNEAKY